MKYYLFVTSAIGIWVQPRSSCNKAVLKDSFKFQYNVKNVSTKSQKPAAIWRNGSYSVFRDEMKCYRSCTYKSQHSLHSIGEFFSLFNNNLLRTIFRKGELRDLPNMMSLHWIQKWKYEKERKRNIYQIAFNCFYTMCKMFSRLFSLPFSFQ